MEKKLIRIPLQFFGEEPEDDFEENYEDDFEDDAEEPEDEEIGDGEDAEDAEDNAANPEGDESKDGDGEKGTATESDGNGETQLIAELKALGYVGDDLASLASDMKTKREAKDATAKSKQRQADLKASQAHIKGAKPGQSATAGAGSGFTERQVSELSARTGCSKDRARSLLAKHLKLINGG